MARTEGVKIEPDRQRRFKYLLSVMQGIQSLAGQGVSQSFTATFWFGSTKLGNISVTLDTSNRVSQTAVVQIFAAGGAVNGGVAAVAVEAGYQAQLLIKTADISGYTFMEGDYIDHNDRMQLAALTEYFTHSSAITAESTFKVGQKPKPLLCDSNTSAIGKNSSILGCSIQYLTPVSIRRIGMDMTLGHQREPN